MIVECKNTRGRHDFLGLSNLCRVMDFLQEILVHLNKPQLKKRILKCSSWILVKNRLWKTISSSFLLNRNHIWIIVLGLRIQDLAQWFYFNKSQNIHKNTLFKPNKCLQDLDLDLKRIYSGYFLKPYWIKIGLSTYSPKFKINAFPKGFLFCKSLFRYLLWMRVYVMLLGEERK
jgi:hypothetical protein